MARRRRNTVSSRLADSAKDTGGRVLSDWAALTFRADSARIGPLPMAAINWILLALCLVGLWFLPEQRKIILIALAVGLLITLGRATTIMPKRRKALATIYDQNQRSAGLPRGSANAPIDPKTRIHVTSWGKKQPEALTMTIGDCPAAMSVYGRPTVEKSLSASLGDSPSGTTWVFDWQSNTQVRAYTASEGSSVALRQMYSNKVRNTTAKLFGIRARDAGDYHFECSDWASEETRQGSTLEVPSAITINVGDFDTTDLTAREKVERALDKQLKTPGEWIYDWDDSSVEMTRVDRKSTEAQQKRTTRKIGDDVSGLVGTDGRSQELPRVSITHWMAKEHLVKLLNTDDVPVDFPQKITIDFGLRNLSDRRRRDRFESDFDTAMGAIYPQVRWVYNWEMVGGATVLYTQCVAPSSKRALRKAAERRLRNVVESKFGSSRNFVDCDIQQWQNQITPNGEALPQEATVNFGDYDVTKRETQEAFEQHWDSLTTACDWHYSWSPAEGVVTINAVPALPTSALFPLPGTDDFTWITNQARQGKIIFGLQKGGGHLEWDLNETPHALVGGATGSGKSVTLTTLLLLSMYNVDLFELYVCDPKRTDFTWTPEFPNVTKFAAEDAEIVAAVSAARQEMDRRQSLLSRVGVRNIRQLREKYRQEPELVQQFGPAPRRLVIFFDELADFLAKSADKDLEELKDEARSDLENIARLGSAMEVNILAAAQKPAANVISTQLRSQLGMRICVGPVDNHTSKQILESDHGTRFPGGSPKGRCWAWDSKNSIRMAQSFFLPDETGPLPWDASANVPGTKDIVRARLQELGYARTEITNADGGLEPRWVRVEDSELVDSFDDASDESPQEVVDDPSSKEPAVMDVSPLEGDAPEPEIEPLPPASAPESTPEPVKQPESKPAKPRRRVQKPARAPQRPTISLEDEEQPF